MKTTANVENVENDIQSSELAMTIMKMIIYRYRSPLSWTREEKGHTAAKSEREKDFSDALT